MNAMIEYADIIILWVHVFTAIFFVGGSFFIWLVDEIMQAARNDQNSHAVSKKEEIERVAASAR